MSVYIVRLHCPSDTTQSSQNIFASNHTTVISLNDQPNENTANITHNPTTSEIDKQQITIQTTENTNNKEGTVLSKSQKRKLKKKRKREAQTTTESTAATNTTPNENLNSSSTVAAGSSITLPSAQSASTSTPSPAIITSTPVTNNAVHITRVSENLRHFIDVLFRQSYLICCSLLLPYA